MHNMYRLLLSCFLLIGTLSLSAQDQYTIELGAFQDVSQKDFADLLPLGFVYGNKIESNVHLVFLGTFDEQSKADVIVTQLRTRGFSNARVLRRPAANQNVILIQLSTKLLGTKLDYATLEKAGKIFIEQTNSRLKVLSGPYPDMNAAQTALSEIRNLGYKDAFPKTLDFNRLIPITGFETGIKAPLIPINISEQPVVPSPYGQPVPNAEPSNPSPAPTSPVNTGATQSTATVGARLPDASIPNIRGDIKRSSAVELQKVLTEKGFYTSSIDGFYGNGTKSAYEQAWSMQEDVQKYRALLPLMVAVPIDDPLVRWPSSALLMTIAKDLAAGMDDPQLAAQSVAKRKQLYTSQAPLPVVVATRAENWSKTLLLNLEKWAQEDPVHAKMETAFRIAYYQTQVLLEDYYMNRGFTGNDAKFLALATLQNMVGSDLVRFL